ncbi:hypothetical protein AB0937_33575 [Streptomyces sp. NPDC047880]
MPPGSLNQPQALGARAVDDSVKDLPSAIDRGVSIRNNSDHTARD